MTSQNVCRSLGGTLSCVSNAMLKVAQRVATTVFTKIWYFKIAPKVTAHFG